MGYYVNLASSNVVVKKEHLDAAYKAMIELNDHDGLKRGGSSTGKKWFSWMPEDIAAECPDAQSVLECLGFTTEIRSNGDLWISGYDSKIGQEELFLKAIAPYVGVVDWHIQENPVNSEPYNPQMEWVGEDGEFWMHVFKNNTLYTAAGEKTYKSEQEVEGF
jgi:hypothetical protein